MMTGEGAHTAIVIAGGNVGDRERLLSEAFRLLGERAGEVVKISRRFRSAAWGFSGDEFLNAAAELRTKLEPEELLDAIHEIERELGRDRSAEAETKRQSGERYASRTMDIDILFYDDLVMNSERLTIPHPRIAERLFVLEPLADIAAERVHPVAGVTVRELLERFVNRKG